VQLSRRGFVQALAAAPLALAGCAGRSGGASATDEQLQQSFFCFDTACAVGGVMEQELLDACVARCEGFEQTLSRTIETSDIGRINAAGGAPVEVKTETAELISKALDYCRASDGLFDITIGAVSKLWDFHEGVVPAPEEIEAALPHVGYQNVQVSGTTVTLADPEARLDLGGIAKGYVSDVLLDELAAKGVQSAYVNLGGNVKVLGTKPDGSAWRIGVRDPNDPDEGSPIARVSLEGGSVVTSGLYERQFEQDGRRYWHILDPRTGYPVETDIISATIVSDRSIDGDGYTKPLFMMDADEARAWLASHSELQVLLVDAQGDMTMWPEDSFELL
jgi:thiamine biosynthesis lipoprotein